MNWSKFVGVLALGRASLPAILATAFVGLTALASGQAALAHDDRDDGTVRVMTRNLYHGFDPAVIVAAPAAQIPFAAASAFNMIQASKPAERAAAAAREIVRNRVDLVGLQEATLVRKGPLQLPPNPATFLPATEVVSDNLELLLDALERLGERYHVVAIVPGLDAQLPTALGFDARVTLRDVIIARSNNSGIKLSNVQMQTFLVNRTFPTASGIPLPNPRGWISVDVEKDGRKFRFANAHLEEPHPVQTPQAHDMINGAGNTTLPVVFVGDFNVVANSGLDPTFPVYQKFINAGFVEAWPLKRAPDPGLTCCQAANLLNPTSQVDRRIDLILLRGALQVVDIRLVGEKPGDRTPSGLWPSDHAGVVATLKIPKKNGHHH
jgi:endonuclease/exonuclease/phosphatase family metal-dependent hydrolase